MSPIRLLGDVGRMSLRPLSEAEGATLQRVQVRLAPLSAVVTTARVDCSNPPRSGEAVFVEVDGRAQEFIRLLLRVDGQSSTDWSAVDVALEQEGFDPYGPRTELGQTYQSRNRAWGILNDNPAAERAVDRIGHACLAVVRPPP